MGRTLEGRPQATKPAVSEFPFADRKFFYFGHISGQPVVIAAVSEQEFLEAKQVRNLGDDFDQVEPLRAHTFWAVGGTVHCASAMIFGASHPGDLNNFLPCWDHEAQVASTIPLTETLANLAFEQALARIR